MTFGTTNRHSQQDVIAIFSIILNDAAKMFGRSKSNVTSDQFVAASNGRLGRHSMAKCGGFGTLKAYVLKVKK